MADIWARNKGLMSMNRNLMDLFQAVAQKNFSKAVDVARVIAASEEKKGHFQAAKLLRGSLEASSTGKSLQPQSFLQAENWTVSQGILHLQDPVLFKDLELPATVHEFFDSLTKEWKHRKALEKTGIPRRTKLLFHGPPGCGKSVSARALGTATGLPTYMVRFDSLIGAFLGQTAMRLRELFRLAESTPCVLLFDEVDALAKRRGSPTEVGELDRIVIAFMQELEHSKIQGFIVATSNLPAALDDALWRRFDARVEFPKPKAQTLARFVKHSAGKFDLPVSKALLNECLKAASFAEAGNIVVNRARGDFLSGQK